MMKRMLLALVTTLGALLLSGCGYNALQSGDEAVKAAWAEVLKEALKNRSLERIWARIVSRELRSDEFFSPAGQVPRQNAAFPDPHRHVS